MMYILEDNYRDNNTKQDMEKWIVVIGNSDKDFHFNCENELGEFLNTLRDYDEDLDGVRIIYYDFKGSPFVYGHDDIISNNNYKEEFLSW